MLEDNLSSSPEPIKRPTGVTILGWGVLIIACLNLARLIQAVQQWDFLAELPRVFPLYLALSGLVWGLLALVLGWGIFKGMRWAPAFGRLGTVAYLGYFWLDRWLVQQAPERWTNLPFLLGITTLLGGWIFWYLSKPRICNYFGVNHDR
jgi:hypothetical protein